MDNKFKRAIEHLTKTSSTEKVIEAIQAVEDLFEKKWLEKNDGHRLQILWSRRDIISTSELYSLGKSILKLSIDNRKWLASNAVTIKKDIKRSHGLLTEIITIGSLSSDNGIIKPYPNSFPIYDYSINFKNDYKIKVSVKNFDITDHEREFQSRCDIIKKTFINFLKRTKISGKLTIILHEKILTSEAMNDICTFIVFNLKQHGVYLLNDESGFIKFEEFVEYPPSDLLPHSHAVIILTKQHFNEQRNILDKLTRANEKMLSDPEDSTSLKQLVVRLGATADIDIIHEHLKSIAAVDFRCGFDIFYIFQPTVTTDIDNKSSVIITTIYTGSRKHYTYTSSIEDKLKNITLIKNEIGVGGVSLSKAPLRFLVNDEVADIDLSSNYVYQKGDIYIKASKIGGVYHGELSLVAPGIMTHAVIENMILSPICFSPDDRLLII